MIFDLRISHIFFESYYKWHKWHQNQCMGKHISCWFLLKSPYPLGLHAQIQDFCQGGVGGGAWWPENSLDNVFFLVLSLFYSLQRGSNAFIAEKTILSQGSRGVQHFPGGSNLFQGGRGGPNAYFYRNPYNVIFQGASEPPIPPLDLHMDWGLIFGLSLPLLQYFVYARSEGSGQTGCNECMLRFHWA